MAVSGNPATETIWLRWVPGFCLQKLPLKKPQSKKTRQCLIGNLIPYKTPWSFSTSGFFLYVNFCGKFILANSVKATVNTAKYARNTLLGLFLMSTPDSGNPGYSLGMGIPYVKYIAPEFQV